MSLLIVKPGIPTRSFIDMYLNEMKQSNSKEEKEFLQGALIGCLDNFLMSTSDLVMAFHMLMYCLARNPEVQVSFKFKHKLRLVLQLLQTALAISKHLSRQK